MANGRLERREEAMDLALGYILMLVQAGNEAIDVALGCLLAANAWQTAGWTAQKKRWISVARSETLLQSFNGFKRFRGFRRFKRLGAGKRQAWTPIRSH